MPCPGAERPRILALVSRAPGCGASRAEQKCTLWLVTEGSKSGRAATLQEQDEKASRVRFYSSSGSSGAGGWAFSRLHLSR